MLPKGLYLSDGRGQLLPITNCDINLRLHPGVRGQEPLTQEDLEEPGETTGPQVRHQPEAECGASPLAGDAPERYGVGSEFLLKLLLEQGVPLLLELGREFLERRRDSRPTQYCVGSVTAQSATSPCRLCST